MLRKLWILFLLLIFVVPAQAQGAPLVAFVNSSGQLIVAGADGVTRWIVTNPGETLDPTLGYRWSPDGSALFHAVDLGGAVSLRTGDTASMTVAEIAQVNGPVTGGEWGPNGTLLFGTEAGAVAGAQNVAGQVASPYSQSASSLAPDGSAVIFLQAGVYTLQRPDGSATVLGPSSNNGINAQWSDIAPIVAFSGQTDGGQHNLIVFNTANNNAVMLVGTSLPMEPIGWVPNTTSLLYRDASGTIRIADVGCLQSGCPENTLETGVPILPASALDVQITTSFVAYRDGEQVLGVPLSCVQSQDCTARTAVLGTQAVQRAGVFVAGSQIIYTAYTSDASNPSDREVRSIDANCISNGYCQAVTLIPGAIAGRITESGAAMVADIIGAGLHIVNLGDGSTLYLTDSYADALQTAHWNG